jgi:acyl carrier protein
MSESLWSRLQGLIREFFEDDGIDLNPASVAADVDGWDSLANVELMIEIEREFGVRFKTGELAELESVGALAQLIEHHLAQAGR